MRWGFQLQAISQPSSAAAPSRKRKTSPGAPSSSLDVNVGISLDYGTTSSQFESPLQCVTEARRHVLTSSEHQHARKISPQPHVSLPAPSTTHHCVSDGSYDLFDDCLRAADHMDAVLAYYYADEKAAGAVKVVEIFPVHHHHPAPVVHPAVSDCASPSLPSSSASLSSLLPF